MARVGQPLRQVEQVVKSLLHVIRSRHVIRQREENLREGGGEERRCGTVEVNEL